MKLPRDISGPELARLLKKLGYQITRQSTGFGILMITVFAKNLNGSLCKSFE